jgi:hypothetical protein
MELHDTDILQNIPEYRLSLTAAPYSLLRFSHPFTDSNIYFIFGRFPLSELG